MFIINKVFFIKVFFLLLNNKFIVFYLKNVFQIWKIWFKIKFKAIIFRKLLKIKIY